MDVSDDGRFIAAGGSDGQVIVWDRETRERVGEVRLPGGADLKVVEARGEGARFRTPGSAVTLQLTAGAIVNAFAAPKTAEPAAA